MDAARRASRRHVARSLPGLPEAEQVKFVTAVYGIHAEGTVYRMDEVPLPLRRLCDAAYPTDEQVLGDLERAMAPAE